MSEKEFDKFVDNLQKEIIDKEIEDFNEYIVDLFHKPKNWGKPKDPEITVQYTYEGPYGDTMQFFLKIKDNFIQKVNFITDGCGALVAAGSQTTLLIEGKSLDFAEKIKPIDVDNALKGLPEDHKHCAVLALNYHIINGVDS